MAGEVVMAGAMAGGMVMAVDQESAMGTAAAMAHIIRLPRVGRHMLLPVRDWVAHGLDMAAAMASVRREVQADFARRMAAG